MASQTISPADRIRELSAINADVAAMLQSAGQAITSLTDKPSSTSADDEEDTEMDGGNGKPATMEERKEAFEKHTRAYYHGLQAVVARLRRQAYALEEAGIIAAEPHALASSGQQRQNGPSAGPQRQVAAPVQETERITNGGLGNLDVGWLNSRGNKVGAEKEGELVEEAKKLLEQTLSQGDRSDEGVNGT